MTKELLLILPALFVGGSAASEKPPPRFETAPCPFEESLQLDEVRCGYLVVPENRERPGGRELRLAVSILESTGDVPRPDPLVFLSGGPGAASVENTMQRLDHPFWNRYRKDRDLVFFDQRGTGYSEPKFCSELDAALYTAAFRGMSVVEQRAFENRAVKACRQQMLDAGIDFGSYNSIASALDMDDLRRALGYDNWNLFGVSYGTRLAMTAMRDTPDGIRSVVLDSTAPPNMPVADDNARLMRSLRLVFDQCAADANCRAAFPSLEQDFFSMLEDLEADPLVLEMGEPDRFPDGRMVVDGTLMAAGVFQGLYASSFPEILPLLVREVGNRNTDVLAALVDGLVQDPGYLSAGLLHSVNCYELVSRSTREMVEADRALHPELRVWHEFEDLHAICDAWHDARAEPFDSRAVSSEIPTLIAAGEFDPITPPSYGKLAAEGLKNSTYIEVRGKGHGVIPFDECTEAILESFLDEPMQPLDTSCLDEIPKTTFVTDVLLSPGVRRLSKQLQGGLGPAGLAAIGGMLLLLVSCVILWPLVWIVRRVLRRPASTNRSAAGARWLAALASVLALGFLGGLAVVVLRAAEQSPFLLAFGVPGHARPLFLLPWFAVPATIGVVFLAFRGWKQRWWNAPGRIHYSLVAAACVGFVVWIAALGLF